MSYSVPPPVDASTDTSVGTPVSDIGPWARLRRQINSPLVVALMLAVIWSGFAKWRLSAANNDVTRFIVAGSQIVDGTQTPTRLYILNGDSKGGYDGQYVYRFALEPLTRAKVKYGVNLDAPGYRQMRILLPTLAWAMAGGSPAHIPTALVLVNVLALYVLSLTAALYARALGRSPWWGTLIALYPGYLLTLSRDLTEIVGGCFLLLALLLLRRQRPALATVALCLAVLGRDTSVFVAGAVGMVWLWEQGIRLNLVPARLRGWVMGASDATPRLPFYVPAVPIALYIGWLFYLRSVWGKFPFQEYIAPFEPLFLAMFRFLGRLAWGIKVSDQGPLSNMWLNQCLLLIIFAVVTLVLWRRTRANLIERVAWLLFVALASFYGEAIWLEDFGFLRTLSEFWLLTTILFIASPFRHKAILTTLALASFWLTFQSFSWR